MAQSAAAQKPEGQTADMEEIRENISKVAASAKMQTSLAQSAVWSSSPEAGTVCGSSARTGLCGGCPVRGIPTVLQQDRVIQSKKSSVNPVIRSELMYFHTRRLKQ